MPCVFGTCPPCNCATLARPKPTDCRLQQWLTQANDMGRKWVMNPVTLLAIASIESEGSQSNWDKGNGAYGIVQVTSWYLNPYNCFTGTNYALTDLAAKGPNVTDPYEAVRISFDILGKLLRAFNDAHSSFRLSATAWNGTGCGWTGGYVNVWAKTGCTNTAIKDPSNVTCYGHVLSTPSLNRKDIFPPSVHIEITPLVGSTWTSLPRT